MSLDGHGDRLGYGYGDFLGQDSGNSVAQAVAQTMAQTVAQTDRKGRVRVQSTQTVAQSADAVAVAQGTVQTAFVLFRGLHFVLGFCILGEGERHQSEQNYHLRIRESCVMPLSYAVTCIRGEH